MIDWYLKQPLAVFQLYRGVNKCYINLAGSYGVRRNTGFFLASTLAGVKQNRQIYDITIIIKSP
jgi:hypothetical protein